MEAFLLESLVEANDRAASVTFDGLLSVMEPATGIVDEDREGRVSVGWYGGGTESSNSEVSETATSTIELKLSKSKEARRRLVSLGRFLPSTLASSHGCPMFSTSFLDFERDLETESDRLSFDCFASFCPLVSFTGAGIRYPSLVNASI
jgi:hypothetical protein